MQWNNLKKFHLYNSSYAFERTDEVNKNYSEYKSRLSKEGVSVADDIKSRFIKERIVVRKNDFPYNLSFEITHLVAWTFEDVLLEEVIEELKKLGMIEIEDFIAFQNSPDLRTVQDIKHYHIFVKNDIHLMKAISMSSKN